MKALLVLGVLLSDGAHGFISPKFNSHGNRRASVYEDGNHFTLECLKDCQWAAVFREF